MEYDIRSQSIVILIFGAPSTGKTTLGGLLTAHLNGAPLVSMDLVKEWVQLSSSHSELRFTSHNAWKIYGKKNPFNIVQGFKTHARPIEEALLLLLKQLCDRHKIVIVEGVHITEELIQSLKKVPCRLAPFYTCLNEALYEEWTNKKKQMRKSSQNPWLRDYSVIEILDRYFYNLAGSLEHALAIEMNQDFSNILNIFDKHFKGILHESILTSSLP